VKVPFRNRINPPPTVPIHRLFSWSSQSEITLLCDLSLAKTLSDEAGRERRVCQAGVVRSSNGGPSGEGAERIFASRRESTRSTPPVEPEVFDPWVATIVTSGRQAFVTMVQAAHLGERDDLVRLRTLHWSWFRGIFVQAQMGPAAVVIFEVGFE